MSRWVEKFENHQIHESIEQVKDQIEGWNCYKKMDNELSQIMQPVLVVGLNNLAFPPVCGSQA